MALLHTFVLHILDNRVNTTSWFILKQSYIFSGFFDEQKVQKNSMFEI